MALLGIDVSTTGAKALIVDEKGEVLASVTHPLKLSTPQPLWSEQDPLEWWAGTVSSVQGALKEAGVLGKDIAGVGLTGQMHGLVLLDAEGKVLRPAILWNDQRTGAQCAWITETVGFDRLLEYTGNPALTGFTAPKVIWVREHEPEVYARVAQILLPKDYIRYRLSGAYATDLAGAAGTMLLDVKKRQWSREVLEALDIPAAWLPPTHEGPQVTGVVSAEAAALTGLAAGTPIVGGGGDQAAQAVGVGAVRPGVAALTVGTSGVVFVPTDRPVIEPQGRLHAFCHAVPGAWHLMGVMLSAAGSLQWYRDQFAPGVDFDTLLAPAEAIPPGSEGLYFLPYLTGERTPHPDPLARGAFVGLTVRHTMAHLTRAVLEGVAFGLADSFALVKAMGVADVTQLRASGGGVRSALWRQILADVLGAELVTVNVTEGAAYGAALLAGVGAGVWPDVPAACDATVRITSATRPDASRHEVYAGLHAQYRELYPALKPTFHAVG
ncbi:MAG: xylulokinase [Anaerolineae bacterium]